MAEHQRFELWRRYKRPIAFRVFWYISKLTVFVGKKRKLSEDDSTDLRRKMLKNKSFLTSERRNSNPFRNADFSGKMREKQAFLARWRDVGEKNRREQKSSIFPIVMGIYKSVLTKFYANSPLPQKCLFFSHFSRKFGISKRV